EAAECRAADLNASATVPFHPYAGGDVHVYADMTYGVECTRGLPGWLFGWSVGLGALAFVVALAAPVRRVRQAALGGQLLAECTALLVILSYYP
ncbi:hypothetical protein ACFVYT_32575, partial [Streptomyces sp. NPDC058290]|uniref:hypothetical protein n=1 Tax=Streptomyces sp. NPDC058290 TaxID=3346426 RepID=UPI0036E756F7